MSRCLRREPGTEQIKPSKQVVHSYPEFVRFAASLQIDVGIAPLLASPFNFCKSNVKFQEYAALGIAGVYSDLPPYREGVRPGENGLLAASPDQWRLALEQLVASSELRSRLTLNASEDLQATWRLGRAGELWNETLAMAIERTKSRSAGAVHPVAAIVDGLIEYQTDLERQLKQSVRYQVGKIFTRLARKWAA